LAAGGDGAAADGDGGGGGDGDGDGDGEFTIEEFSTRDELLLHGAPARQ